MRPPSWLKTMHCRGSGIFVIKHCVEPDENNLPDSFRTLDGVGETELKVKRSRFLAMAFAAATEPEARTRLDETARRYHDALHVCFAFRLGIGPAAVSRKSDAGEPNGTAGEPILAAIDRLGLTDVLVIVVRYFGGIKLGTGGLARAYGQAAETALEAAGVRVVPLGREFVLRFPYALDKSIRHLLDTRQGRLLDQDYGEEVVWRIWLPHSIWRGFAEALKNLTAGAVVLDEPED
jgi:uncharacterized YigZ family protein